MRVQCSIRGSTLGGAIVLKDSHGTPLIFGNPPVQIGLAPALTESPLHVLQGNQDIPLFFSISVVAASTAPAFCKYSCQEPSGDDLTDALNYFNYSTSHTYGITEDRDTTGDGLNKYVQTDTLDANTFDATSADVETDTFPDLGFNGGDAPIWNSSLGYINQPGVTTSSSNTFDKGPTRAGIAHALATIDWDSLWKGLAAPASFVYDRAQLNTETNGLLPFGGTHSGNLVASSFAIAPRLVGVNGGELLASDNLDQLGISLTRTQIQVRNLTIPVEYFIVEEMGLFRGIRLTGDPNHTGVPAGRGRNPLSTQFLHVSGGIRVITTGLWVKDLQIVELPPPPNPNAPFVVSNGVGTFVCGGSSIRMVVGQTFNEWAFQTFGANWRNFLV